MISLNDQDSTDFIKGLFFVMETKEIIILIACLLAVGFSLYRKYVQKSAGKSSTLPGAGSTSQFSSVSKDDDYEPYSGNKK